MKYKILKCPSCASSIVYEIDQTLKRNSSIENIINTNLRAKSPSQCSIGKLMKIIMKNVVRIFLQKKTNIIYSIFFTKVCDH